MNTRMGITTSLVVSLLLLAIIACAETAPSPTPARTEAAVGMQPTQGPTTSSQLTANDRQSPGVGPIPAPPPSPPILGEKVSLDEARRRTPYPIPIPPDGVVGADIQEVWASKEGAPTEFRQVYLIYANGLKISIGGRPDAIDYSALADDPFPSSERSRDSGVRQRPCRQNSKHRRPSQYSCESQLVGESGGHRTVPSDLVYGATA